MSYTQNIYLHFTFYLVMVDTQLTMLLATSFIMTFLKRYYIL